MKAGRGKLPLTQEAPLIKDIRMIHSDGDYLLLETESGDKFRLLIDDTLRQSIRRETSLRLDETSTSPREIQEWVRSGKSVEQIIAETGDNEAFVNKFAAPVLDEMAWVLDNAKSVRLVVAEDKFHDPTFAGFGEIISERINNRGGGEPNWAIRRTETSQWLVSVSYQAAGKDELASWIFDPGQSSLEPQNAVAIDLSSNRGEPMAAKTPLTKPVQAAKTPEPDTAAATVSEAGHKVVPLPVTKDEKPEASTPGPVLNFSPDTAMPDLEPGGGLVDEIRRRREKSIAAAASDAESMEATQELPTIEKDELHQESAPETSSVAPSKKGRASIPSWDEIVFGTKADEPEAP